MAKPDSKRIKSTTNLKAAKQSLYAAQLVTTLQVG